MLAWRLDSSSDPSKVPSSMSAWRQQIHKLAGRPEIKGAFDAVSDKGADLADSSSGVVANVTGNAQGPIGSIDQSKIDAETEAVLDIALKGTFPSSDPASYGLGPTSSRNSPKLEARDSPTGAIHSKTGVSSTWEEPSRQDSRK